MTGDRAESVPLDAGAMPVAYEARTEFEAQCVRALLEDAGIRSMVVPSGASIFGFPMRASGVTVPVRVLPEDLSHAKQAISEAKFVGRSIDWDDADLGEMAPDVARALGAGRRARMLRRVAAGIVWAVLALVAATLLLKLFRVVGGR